MLCVAAGSAHSNNWLADRRRGRGGRVGGPPEVVCVRCPSCARPDNDQIRAWAAVGRPEVQMPRLQKPTSAPCGGAVPGIRAMAVKMSVHQKVWPNAWLARVCRPLRARRFGVAG